MNGFKPYSLNIRGVLKEFTHPVAMGIINVTPDSFFSRSRVEATDLIDRASAMVADGAEIIDVGGCSTRPGFEAPTADEELARVVPAISLLRKALPDTIISVDTYRAAVAKEAIHAGADIINDISGLDATDYAEEEMFTTVVRLNVPYILTASFDMKGIEPDDSAAAMVQWLQQRLTRLTLAGVNDVVIDPGFGFGKTLEQNHAILRDLGLLHALGCPILAGLSRKSMIFKKLSISPEESLAGTIALDTVALLNGAAILRVHDVTPAVQTIKLLY